MPKWVTEYILGISEEPNDSLRDQLRSRRIQDITTFTYKSLKDPNMSSY